MKKLLILMLLIFTSCILDFPDERESGRFKCNSDQECLPDFQCENNFCVEKDYTTLNSVDAGYQDASSNSVRD